VGGTLSIRSGFTRGTEILAEVPLPRGAIASSTLREQTSR
jgi:hypothetical protein